MIQWLLNRLHKTTITIKGKPYLTRYYLLFREDVEENKRSVMCKFGNLFIHHFHSSDQGDELHSHPWKWAVSFIFRRGYHEEFRVNDQVHSRLIKAPKLNFITEKDFHRVDLLDEEKGSWSIFFAGPRTGDWGFWNRHTREFKDWRQNPEAIP